VAKTRTGTWISLILLGVALLVIAIPGMWVFMRTTATKLHPDPQDVTSVAAKTPSPKWADAVDEARQAVSATLTEKNLPGLSVAVGINGEIVWAEGFGFANLDSRTAITPKHRFRIGTASTALTSAAIGLLLENGKLKLEDAIQTHVPAFPDKQWPVTLRHLMAHTAGVINDAGDEGPLYGEHCERPADAVRHFAKTPLMFEPGTKYRYSSYGWILISAAIEAAAGKPLFTFMQEQIFKPLGMQDTLPESGATPVPERVTFYFPRFAADPTYGLHLMRDLDYSCYAGASALLSTPSDLVRFAMAVNSGKLLRPATVQLLQTSQRLASGQETKYGLGWDIENVTLAGKPTRVIGPDGEALGGMVASLMTFPDSGLVVAVTSNISYSDTFTVGTKIAQAFTNQRSSSGAN